MHLEVFNTWHRGLSWQRWFAFDGEVELLEVDVELDVDEDVDEDCDVNVCDVEDEGTVVWHAPHKTGQKN